MMTLEHIAQLVGGEVVGGATNGDSQIEIHGIETIEGASPGDLTFAIDKRNFEKLEHCKASAVIVSDSVQSCALPSIRCADVKAAFSIISKQLRPAIQRPSIGISPGATVSPTAMIGENVNIYPGAFVGDHTIIGDGTTILPNVCLMEHCQIGKDVTIYPNAVVYENSIIGDRCILHSNSVIGAFGFGYDSGPAGHKLSPQLGNVALADDVEIGAGTTIDRGTYGTTRIGTGTKVDNQVQIGHNCKIGSHNLFCSQVGIAGSTQTGDFVVMGGQVGVGDHLTIDDSVLLCAQSGVMHNLKSGTYLGSPATPVREQFQVISLQAKLPEIRKHQKKLLRRVEKLENALNSKVPQESRPQNSNDSESKAA